MFVETKGFKPNETAVMTSKVYDILTSTLNPNEEFKCLEFYYYMNGEGTAKLNVKAKTPSTSATFPLWSRNYDHGSFWWKGSTNIKLITNYSIVFEAMVGPKSNNNALIALDDVRKLFYFTFSKMIIAAIITLKNLTTLIGREVKEKPILIPKLVRFPIK